MGTVASQGNIKLVVATKDHRPAHCHAIKGQGLDNCEFNFRIYFDTGVIEHVSGKMNNTEKRVIARLYSTFLTELVEEFNRIHGVEDEEA